MGGLRDIARHFGLKAAYVLAAWGVTRIFRIGRRHFTLQLSQRERNDQSRPAPAAETRAVAKASLRYKVYRNPTSEWKPSNPRWLQEAASLDPAELATDLSWQCPLLLQFQADVAGAGRSFWRQQQQQQQQQSVSPHKGLGGRGAAGGGGGSCADDGTSSGGLGGDLSPAAVPFGRQARQQLFALDPDVTYLNHGSYGAAFRQTHGVLPDRCSPAQGYGAHIRLAHNAPAHPHYFPISQIGSGDAIMVSAAAGSAAGAVHGDHGAQRSGVGGGGRGAFRGRLSG
ncbi:hypothetical protein Vretifemale_18913 [Volvox reticuliferus]|uniref:Uncharacterized protein n=1 Tax=Volvox reticuliferus TaxID=1737510 RepID=A0A8J4CXY9_9CHLO|nr:hypothetical protein Vretifemale_18913 [Volvox reticuliferus]